MLKTYQSGMLRLHLSHTEFDTSLQEHLNCSLATSDVFVVSREAVDRGNYERQLQSTLIICQATEVTAGLYECVVNRSTESGVSVTRVWSANVLLKRETAVGK